MRSETVRIFEALNEFIRIAKEANSRPEVSHIKLSGPTGWERLINPQPVALGAPSTEEYRGN